MEDTVTMVLRKMAPETLNLELAHCKVTNNANACYLVKWLTLYK